MNATPFTATPTMQAHSPARSFALAADALRYAKTAAVTWNVTYAVWERTPRLRKLRTFAAGK